MNSARDIFNLSINTHFEDGIETEFSKTLIEYIKQNGNYGVLEIYYLINTKELPGYLIDEALRWIGRIDDPRTYNERLKLLHKCLQYPDPLVRDGAILGLASMDNPISIHYIRLAIDREYSPELKQDMKQVLKQLKETQHKNRFKWITNLFSYRDYPELRFEEWNCSVLCESCHKKFHSTYGNRNNNLNQFIEFYKNITTNDYINTEIPLEFL